MSRFITWYADQESRGWSCSQCAWKYPSPTLLNDPDAKEAYDRLARSSFQEHDCAKFLRLPGPGEEKSFPDRVRELLTRGYRPKDAVELVLQEIRLEHRNQPKVLAEANADAEQFLRFLREGKI
jgi:uncharacterized protein YoaH (UPF0181 family)